MVSLSLSDDRIQMPAEFRRNVFTKLLKVWWHVPAIERWIFAEESSLENLRWRMLPADFYMKNLHWRISLIENLLLKIHVKRLSKEPCARLFIKLSANLLNMSIAFKEISLEAFDWHLYCFPKARPNRRGPDEESLQWSPYSGVC